MRFSVLRRVGAGLLALALCFAAGCGTAVPEEPKMPTVLVAANGGKPIPSPELLAAKTYQKHLYELPDGMDIATSVRADGQRLYLLCTSSRNAGVSELWQMNLESGAMTKLYTFTAQPDGSPCALYGNILRRPGGGVLIQERTFTDHFAFPDGITEETAGEDRWKYFTDTEVSLRLYAFTESGAAPKKLSFPGGGNIAVAAGADTLFTASGSVVSVYTPEGALKTFCDAGLPVYELYSVENTVYALVGTGADGAEIFTVDASTGTMTPSDAIPYRVLNLYADGISGGILATQSGNVFFCQPGQVPEKLVDWLEYGILPTDIIHCTMAQNGTLAAVIASGTDEPARIAVLTPSATAVLPARTLTLGVAYQTEEIADAVLAFNAAQQGKIRIVDYSEYDLFPGENGTARMAAEIASEHCPDMLYSVDPAASVDQLAAGRLLDLSSLLTADPELQREGIFSSVTQLLQTEGKLYALSPSFVLHTAIGRESVIGSGELTLQRLSELSAALPEGGTILNFYANRSTVLSDHLRRCSNYLHTQNGYELRSQVFYDGLTLASLFPQNTDLSTPTDDVFDGWTRVREGKQLLLSDRYRGLELLIRDLNSVGEDSRLYGFPGTPGGYALEFPSTVGITSVCRDPESAWLFVRSLMTADAQQKRARLFGGFPTNIMAFSALSTEAMTAGEVPALPEPKLGIVSLRPTEAQYAMITDAINGAVARIGLNYDFEELVLQEAQAYFDGKLEAPVLAEQLRSMLEARSLR